MDFLAVSPGVHSIDTLTLTDVETGFAMNLRWVFGIEVIYHAADEWFVCRAVMDIVVHDPLMITISCCGYPIPAYIRLCASFYLPSRFLEVQSIMTDMS